MRRFQFDAIQMETKLSALQVREHAYLPSTLPLPCHDTFL